MKGEAKSVKGKSMLLVFVKYNLNVYKIHASQLAKSSYLDSIPDRIYAI